MTYFLDGPARLPDPFAQPAPRPFTTPGERFRAGRTEEDILADRGSLLEPGVGDTGERRRALLDAIATRLGPDDDPDFPSDVPLYANAPPAAQERMRMNRYLNRARENPGELLSRARQAAAMAPERWGDLPLTAADLDARITADRAAVLEDAREVLDMAPEDAFGVETLGAMQSDFATPENAVAMGLSALIPGGPLARIGGEGVLSAGVELAEVPVRNRVAAELGEPEVDPLQRAALGFAFGAGFQGVLEGAGKALRLTDPEARAKSWQSARNAIPGFARRADPVQAAGAMKQAEEAVASGNPAAAPGPMAEGMPDRDALIEAVIKQESRGNPDAVSSAGAIGLMQVRRAAARDPGFGVSNIFDTARDLGKQVPDESAETLDLLLRDAEVNRAFGSAYLDALIKRYGDLDLVLAAYNAEPAVADAWLAAGKQRLFSMPDETRKYLKGVRSFLNGDSKRDAVTYDGTTIRTPAGTRHPVEYRIVELDSLTVSHVDGQINPSFPPELQPRDRGRATSEAQIEEIARDLDPMMLGRGPSAADGAPVTGPDGVVEAGNGRIEALRRVYETRPGNADAYRDFLSQEGFDVAGFARPVLVRARLDAGDTAERAAFARAANDRTTAEPTPTERAQSDARSLPDSALALFEGGDIRAPGNRDFVRAAMAAIPPADRGALTAANGQLSEAGARRIEQTLLARAYDDSRVLDLMLEAPDELSRTVTGAMQDVAADAARLRGAVARGDLEADFDIGGDIAGAVMRVRQARARGDSIGDALDQQDLLRAAPDGLDAALTRMLFADDAMTRLASRREIGERLGTLIQRLRAEEGGPGLFGDDLRMSAGDIAAGVLRDAGIAPLPVRGGGVPGPAGDLRRLLESGAPEEAIDAHPALREALERQAAIEPTANRPGYGSDDWIATRAMRVDGKSISGYDDGVRALHESAGRLAWADDNLPVPQNAIRAERRAAIVLGPPAAGKSTVANPIARRLGAVVVDPDEAKKALPEFDGGPGANAVHEESSLLARLVQREAVERGENIVIPAVGSSADSIRTRIAALKSARYRVDLVDMRVPYPEARRRMLLRYTATGRLIDPEYMRQVGDNPGRTYDILREEGIADDYTRLDNSGPQGAALPVLESTGDLLEGTGLRLRRGGGEGRGADGDAGNPPPRGAARRAAGGEGLEPRPRAARESGAGTPDESRSTAPASPPATGNLKPLGETPKDVARAMQMERDIREEIARDPGFAEAVDPATGLTTREQLEQLEQDADLAAVLDACTLGGRVA